MKLKTSLPSQLTHKMPEDCLAARNHLPPEPYTGNNRKCPVILIYVYYTLQPEGWIAIYWGIQIYNNKIYH